MAQRLRALASLLSIANTSNVYNEHLDAPPPSPHGSVLGAVAQWLSRAVSALQGLAVLAQRSSSSSGESAQLLQALIHVIQALLKVLQNQVCARKSHDGKRVRVINRPRE
jgi:hypothetical protein